jgi:hypothetical protein
MPTTALPRAPGQASGKEKEQQSLDTSDLVILMVPGEATHALGLVGTRVLAPNLSAHSFLRF